MPLRWGAATDTGRRRSGNEDRLLKRGHLAAVADGMGGAAAGEVASQTAIAALAPLAEEVHWPNGAAASDALRGAILRANEAVYELASSDPKLDGMGTTLTAVLEDGNTVHVAHVGDSRAYLLRRGELSRLTEDHTLVAEFVREGRISANEAERHPQRNVITRVIGVDDQVDVETATFQLLAGDRLMLCTDGLTDVVPETMMRRTLRRVRDPQKAAERLVEAANDAGGPDNITVIVLDTAEVSTDVPTSELSGPDGLLAAFVADGAAARPSSPKPAGAHGRVVAGGGPLAVLRDHGRFLARTGVVLVLLAVAVVGARVIVDSRYFVGIDDHHVAIFRGVPGEVAGLSLSSVVEQSPITVNQLPGWEVDNLAEGIPASSVASARATVRRIQARFVTGPSKTRHGATRRRTTPPTSTTRRARTRPTPTTGANST